MQEMLKAIIVDDEPLAIHRLKSIVEDTKNVKVISSCMDGNNALSVIKDKKPDVVFLDITMPGLTGIEIATEIMKESLGVQIVFVTAYEEYALRAFEIGVTDYILKPYEQNRIYQVIQKLVEQQAIVKLPTNPHFSIKQVAPSNKQSTYSFHSFKYFHIKKDGKEIKNIKWRTHKARELFMYMIQHSGEIIRKDVLVELFWPDVEPKKAFDNLYTRIYQLRRTLQETNIDVRILNSSQGYEVVLNDITYDVLVWKGILEKLEGVLSENRDVNQVLHLYKMATEIYAGHYLEEETNSWKEGLKEQYMVMFLSVSQRVINLLRNNHRRTDAILIALHLQKLYPFIDYPYFMLMQLYSETGDRYNLEKHYHALKVMSDREFGASPDREIREWYQQWISSQYVND